MTPAGRLKIDTNRNALVVSDTPEVLQAIEKRLMEVDNPQRNAKKIITSIRLFTTPVNKGSLTYPITGIFRGDYFGEKYISSRDIFGVTSALLSEYKELKLLFSSDTEVEAGACFTFSTGPAEVSVVPEISYNADNPAIQIQLDFKWKNIIFHKDALVNNGGIWEGGTLTVLKDGRSSRFILLLSPHVEDMAPPRCRQSAGIQELKAEVPEYSPAKNVLVSWGGDRPFGANGIARYMIYRDSKPILFKDKNKLIVNDLSPEAVWFWDESPKEPGKEYFYAVTAVNPSGDEQVMSKNSSVRIRKTPEAIK